MDVGGWLRSLGLDQYEATFRESEIDGSVLPELTDADLEKLGVPLGHRKRLLKAIAALCGATAAVAPEAIAEPASRESAERRHLTIMFCDLVASTALSTRLDPEDLRSIIGAYHRCVAETVARFDGFVAKYLGDGVLVYFGYPQAHEDDAERAVRAGLALVEAVGKLGGEEPLQVRVGVSTGLVVVGDLLGSGEAQERGVVGETPNLAARLQSAAAPGTIVIGPTTRRLLGNLFEYHDLGAIEVKGFAERVQAYQVIQPSAVESRFEAMHAATTPLVGRDEEIDLLMRRWAQAREGDGCVVLISGEPGIGKSRIAKAMQDRIGAEPHTRLRYFCSPHHQDSALYPAIAQLERAAGFRRDDTVEQRLDKLEAVLAQATNDLSEAAPLIAELLSLPTGDRYAALTLTPQKRKEKAFGAMIAQVEGLSARQPVLMVYEDIHWSDPTTRESLDLLIDRVPSLRVLVIVTFRPVFTPPWVGRPHVTLLSLNRLPARQRAEMINRVTSGKALPRQIAEQIIDRTDGVPLFIEELTKAVVESGMLKEADGAYAITGPIPSLAIPTSLQASLLARLDRLAPVREVAQIGAALGRSFSHELISAVAEMPQRQLDDALVQLARAELVFRRGTPPDAEYTFKHALVRDAAYDTLLKSRRQQIHARIAATLERQFPEIATAQPELMAQHLAEAGLNEKAVGYWLTAGRLAVARSAMAEAVAQLQKGLDLLTSLPEGPARQQQELDLQVTLGPALIATRGYPAPEVGAAIARARALAEQLDRADYLVALLYAQCWYHVLRSEYHLAKRIAEEMEQIGRERNDAATLLLGRYLDGFACFSLGEFATARVLQQRCDDLREPANRAVYAGVTAEDPYSCLLAGLGVTLAHLGYLDQAQSRTNEALAEARRLKHAYTLVFVLGFACWAQWPAGKAQEAQRHVEELVAVSNEHGFPTWLGWGTVHRGWSLMGLGRTQEGFALLTEGLSTVRSTGELHSVAWVLIMLAEADAKLGRPREGLERLAEAERIVDATDERCAAAELYRLRGDLLNAIGDRPGAEENYHRARAIAERQSAKIFELRAATSLAYLWLDQGKRSEARALVAPIYDWFTEGFDTPVLKEASALLEKLA